ncbi:MAG: OsmC family protein [Haloarculaceae archaeon]
MARIETYTDNESDYEATSDVGDAQLTVHATGKTAPSPNEVLLADYASCFSFAVRAAARDGDVDDLGRMEVDARGQLDADDDLESVRFTLRVESQLADTTENRLLEDAHDLCHVEAALHDGLIADVEVETDAF